jgi:hypothetical protein
MVKKILIVLLALGTLNFVPSAEARYRKSCRPCKKVCPKKVCPRPCVPECTTKVHREIFYKPCKKLVEIEGQCPWERCTKVTTCTSESAKCVGPCAGECESVVIPNGDIEVNEE